MSDAFDNEKYKELQKEAIAKRIEKFGKLYMEIGGKLFDDHHAARVLPGFDPSVKMQIFSDLKDELEVIFCINARDIITKKVRGDNNLSYAEEVFRLCGVMRERSIEVCGLMITFYEKHPLVTQFEERAKAMGTKVYHSYYIEDYPDDIDKIISEEGFGKNDYIPTTKNLILVSAPGANSGKLETCLSQMYNDKAHGIKSMYAKYETFPVYNLPLEHLVNVAYEMATVDIEDKNMIDPFFKGKDGEVAVNYNRDIEAFPILREMIDKIMGYRVYNSPTEMGINCVKAAIVDDLAVQRASLEEIKLRHERHLKMFSSKSLSSKALDRGAGILKKAEKLFDKLLKSTKK